MISVQDIYIAFGDRILFDHISFLVNKGERIGLAGKNGAGKSTLLKVMAGLQTPGGGVVAKPNGLKTAYLPQEIRVDSESSVKEEAAKGLSEIVTASKRIKEIEHELENSTGEDVDGIMKLTEELTALHERMDILQGYNYEENVVKILEGLGFTPEEQERPVNTFSGGWKMRVELAKILLANPDLMLLDEPTNHLDIESIEWLENFLLTFPGAVLLISHDRKFLDNCTSRTIEITNGRLYDYRFPYSKYIEKRLEEIELQTAAKKNQDRVIRKTEMLIDKYRAKASKASFAQSLIKKLDKMDRVEVDDLEDISLSIQIPPSPHSGKVVLEMEHVQKSYPGKPIFDDVNLIISKGERIALVGKNGIGKSTFVRMLNKKETHGGVIKFGHSIEVGYFAQDEAERLNKEITVWDTVDKVAVGEIRTKLRGMLGAFMFGGDDIMKKVKVLSGGEKTRLALCRMFLSPINFMILDEPTNHLDLASKEVLKQALLDYDGTMLIVSHDRDFLDGLTNKVYEIRNGGMSVHPMDLIEYREFVKRRSAREKKESVTAKPVEKKKENTVAEVKVDPQKEQKKNQNRLNKIEQEIAKTEAELKEAEEKISTLDYSNKEETEKTLGRYNQLKEQRDLLYKEWEELS